ncbi:WG repeat-containing protein [Aquimarina algicola]|uniref:WG repeat-containing protein n=1 Tax=Aquimarina algicola TaxID=2589995 RepID=A0A504JEK7_9FLAO|nr:WG repeat-containing protein [Aquimarina algicola]TPN86053.1 WG repeat-containing protein [Aquimarina algicola]
MKNILTIIILFTLTTQLFAQEFELIPYRIDNKWGFSDSNKKILIKPKFQDVIPFNKGYAAFKLNNKWGFIDVKGREIVEPKYDSISEYFQNLFIGGDISSPIYKTGIKVYENNKSFYVDANGTIFKNNPETIYFVDDEEEEIEIIEKNGKYGIKNILFDRTVEPKYDSVQITQIGIIAELNGQFGVINLNTFSVIVPFDYKSIAPTEDGHGFYVTDEKGKVGYFNRNGNEKIAPKYKALVKISYSELEFMFSHNEEIYGYINVSEEPVKVIKPKYLIIGKFINGYSKIKNKNGKYGYINHKGVEYFEN